VIARLATQVRESAGLFHLHGRALLTVDGEDRVRWLNGMVSNDVAKLRAETDHSGCYALLLTPKGRIVTDLHILQRGDTLWLELDASVVDSVRERLEKYVIADDVRITDRTRDYARFGLEGPGAAVILQRALSAAPPTAANAWKSYTLGGFDVTVAAFGWSGEPGFQLFVEREGGDAVDRAIRDAGRSGNLVEADEETLEVLRIEAGIPRVGAELDEEVLPAEADLVERAIAFDKGCYTGQEIVARLDSRGRVQHRLVGLTFSGDGVSGDALPAPGAVLEVAGRATGEVTSACHSASAGSIGLGYVRREHATPGTEVRLGDGADGASARVTALPFVPTGTGAGPRGSHADPEGSRAGPGGSGAKSETPGADPEDSGPASGEPGAKSEGPGAAPKRPGAA